MLDTESHWWAYRHINGDWFFRRYLDEGDLEDAHDSDFVDTVIPPFPADTREDAVRHVFLIVFSP